MWLPWLVNLIIILFILDLNFWVGVFIGLVPEVVFVNRHLGT